MRQVLDTRIDLLAIMMAEAEIDPDTTRARLTTLVHGLRNPRVEETIFAGGRRLAMAVEGDELVLNRELLLRVGDAEVLNALTRPVAQITQLPSVGVSLAFQIDDDQVMRDLTMKAQRRTDGEVVRASSLADWVHYRVETLTERLARLCDELGHPTDFDCAGADELRRQVEGSTVWPEWTDISDVAWCAAAVKRLTSALEGSAYAGQAETIAELLWDSLVLSTQSFVRHAGRTARTMPSSLDIEELLVALATAVSGDEPFSTDLAEWPAYQDVYEAWQELNRHERAIFGPVLLGDETPRASVVTPARMAFGIDAPRELPWGSPLVCWTTREQRGLRDLLHGFIKTLPGDTEHALRGHTIGDISDALPLSTDGDRQMLGVQVVALGSDATLMPAQSAERTWSSCVGRVLQQIESADPYTQEAVLASLRSAYDQLFPASQAIWTRRLFDLDEHEPHDKLVRLVTMVNNLFNVPLFFDPFGAPGSPEIAPLATLVLPVGMTADTRVSFFVPIVALTSTLNGAPIRVRAVEVPAQSDAPCRWLCDRALHLTKLGQQSVELIARSVRGDALQMALEG